MPFVRTGQLGFLVLFTMGCLASLCSTHAAPDEEALGKSAGYPVGTPKGWFYEERTRVGSFSHLDKILPFNRLQKSATPLALPKAAAPLEFSYRFENQPRTLDDFLARQRITSLLIIKDGQVLVERYQYDRKDSHRLVSHSMAKSITSLAVGLALADGKIASLDDTVAKYVPKLAGVAYGETRIRDLLRMSSGVRFIEKYDGKDDLAKYALLRATEGTIPALKAFTDREAPPGTRFHYASIETAALTLLVTTATGKTLSAYLTERLWQPMGAEADATWVKTRDGTEVGGGSFSAVLRDYGRLGVLLANDGMVGGRQIIAKDYLLEATDWRMQPAAFAPRKATPYFGYGYQFWLYPGENRRFALLGVYGQSIFVDPQLKLVMVLTGVAKNANVGKETLGSERDAVWRALIAKYGAW